MPDGLSLPFVTRKMLPWGDQGTFQLIVDVVSHVSGESMQLRGFTKDGPFTFTFLPDGTNAVQTFRFQISDIPIHVSVSNAGTTSEDVYAYAAVYLGVDTNRLTLLAQGTCGGMFGVAWPQSLPQNSMQSDGVVLTVNGTNPAAGAEVSDVVPDNQVWELLGIDLFLDTDANAADRTCRLDIQFEGQIYITRIAGATMQANEEHSLEFIPGGTTQTTVANETQEIALPPKLFLPAGTVIATTTTNIQVGDNYGTPHYFIRRHYQRC